MIDIIAVRKVLLIAVLILILYWVWRAVNWVWFRPKRLEKYLRKQGFSGNSYRVLMGDMRDSNQMDRVAHSLPLPLTADFVPRMMPFLHHTVLNHGKKCFTWYGPYPNVIVMDPETLREIVSRHELFPKPKIGYRVFLSGLLNHEGPTWSKHRNILNPAFRIDNLKIDMSESTQYGDMFLLLVLPWRPHLLIVVVLENPPSLFWLLERPTLIVVVLGCQQIVEMGLHNGKAEEEPFEYEVEEEEGREGPGEEDPLSFCSLESGE